MLLGSFTRRSSFSHRALHGGNTTSPVSRILLLRHRGSLVAPAMTTLLVPISGCFLKVGIKKCLKEQNMSLIQDQTRRDIGHPRNSRASKWLLKPIQMESSENFPEKAATALPGTQLATNITEPTNYLFFQDHDSNIIECKAGY